MKMKRKQDKRGTSVYIDWAVWEHLETNSYVKNLSDWINQTYQDQFMGIEQEAKKLDYFLKEAEKCRERIKGLKNIDFSNLVPQSALNWIKTEGIIRTKRATPEGVLKYFNNTFNQKLSLRQFKLLLKK